GIAYDSSNGDMYVVNSISGTISVIQTPCKVIATVGLGGHGFPYRLAFNPVNGLVYATDAFRSSAFVINGTTVIKTITGLQNASGIAGDPKSGRVFVSVYHQIDVIKGLKVVKTIPIDGCCTGTLAFGGGSFYVGITYGGPDLNKIFVIGA